MSDMPVEKGIPMPEDKKDGYLKHPWVGMEVGDSFFVAETPRLDNKTLRHRLEASTKIQGLRRKTKYAIRSVEGGIRVWRVE